MKEAVEQMIATICWLLDKEKIEEITLINIVVSDGESIVATRFVTNAQEVAYESGKSSTVPDMTGETSPAMPASLYFATGTAWQQQEETCGEFRMTHRDKRTDICIVTSEPLTSNPEDWMPVPRNTMILITPAIDLLLYPIASVGYLPSPLRRRRSSVFLGSTQETSLPPFDKQITLRKGLAESLANRIEGDFESLLEIASSGGSMGTPGVSDELAVMMLRSMENIVREVAAGIEPCDKEERDKAWQALKIKLERLEKQIQAAQVQRQAVAAVEDGQSHSTCGSSTMSSGIPSTNLYHADLNSETLGASQQCYELIAGSCAILCLETIMIYVTNSNEETERDLSSAASASPCLPVVAKTFVFAGMQSGEVVVYDATSASVAPISFQAHEGGVLAMAVHANTLRNGSLSASQNIACKDCGSVVPEIFLVTGGSDTSLAVWDLSPLVFGGREPRLLSGIQVLLDGPRISIAADDLLAVRLTFLPHQGDVLSLLVSDCSGHGAHTTGSRHDPSRRICTVSACDACMQGIRAAMRLDSSGGVSNEYTPSSPVAALHCTADLHKVQPSPFIEDRGCNILLFIGFQSAKIGAVFLSDLLRYFRHTQVMVSVLANAVSFQPAQQQSLSLRVSRDFELKTLASGQVKVQFSGEQERESLGSLFTGGQKCAGSRQQAGRSPIQQGGSASCSPCLSSGLAKYEAFGRLLSGFARSLRCVTLHASHAATTFWSTKCCRSRRPGCLYPPTGTVYCFEAPHELEVPLPEGAAASASPGTYRVVTSTSSLKIVAQPSRKDGGLKIEMRFLPFEQSGVQRQHSHQSLVGPWLDESGHNGFVECLTSCGKGVICSGGGDGRLLLWGENGSLVGELSGHHGGVLCVAYTEAPVESLCRELRNSGERLHITSPQAECTRDSDEVGHSLQGLLFSGSRDSSIRVWALEQFVCIQTLNAHTSEVLALAADASRNILISGSANGELFVWQLDLMVVAFQLSLNPSPSFAESGHFSCTAAHHAFGPCSHEGQERGVSFTGLLLVSDASFFSEHISGSSERSLGAAFASCGKGPGGLQLWAGRGDGKLGVWNINERDLGDEGSVGEDHVKPTSCEGSSACDFAVTETNGPTEGSADKKDTAGEALQNALSPANAENGAADGSREGTRAIPMNAQRLLCANRLSGMVITPGASMPSLPSLTMKTGLEPRRRDFLPLLAQFVAYKSVSASRCPRHVTGCIGAAKFVAQLLEQALGATVDIVWPQRSAVLSEFHGDQWEGQPHPVVFGRLGTNPHHPTIVFYSHYDVVSAGGTSPSSVPASSDVSEGSASPVTVSASPRTRTRTAVPPSNQQGARSSSNSVTQMTKHQGARSNSPGWHGTGWHTNPWKIHCKDGYIYGRGVTDNKGPIICSLLAVKHFISEWRRKYKASQALYERCSQHLDSGEASATQNPAPVKSDPAIPFNFVWICEGDEENGSVGLADAVAQKASWLHGARFLICNNSYWADDVTPCLV
ncbi:WD domain-containing protein, putative [Eimeria necatrix]|uniref:WD domain-containing protein, putative n=1 Tax=Eimeria necatrix TaxID=51315 RepID=U6MW80_9EIME|nr:WD domain-containing protein, putative [Eimeria necatrix]CDJ66744.1 WD domain-containing protein, putative [Eimeria necatrix]